MTRNFHEWLSKNKPTINKINYYTDFEKVDKNIEFWAGYGNIEGNFFTSDKISFCLLDTLIGVPNGEIATEFEKLINVYPEVKTVLPILTAVRVRDSNPKKKIKNQIIEFTYNRIHYKYNFSNTDNLTGSELSEMMSKLHLFDLYSERKIKSTHDYVYGIEVGMDTHARKNRSGDQMEEIVGNILHKIGNEKNFQVFQQLKSDKVRQNTGISFNIKGKQKKFDFVVQIDQKLLFIETNFYNSDGSKPDSIVNDYTGLLEKVETNKNCFFLWITDGPKWHSAKDGIKKYFEDYPDNLMNISDLEDGYFKKFLEEKFYA